MRKLQASEQAEPEPEPQPANKAVESVTSPVTKPKKADRNDCRAHFPPAPVGQQEPPTRAAAPAVRALRVARGSPSY